MTPDYQDYLERRAEDAIRRAQAAAHPEAMRAHYVMASHYLSRLYPAGNDSPQPPNALAHAPRVAQAS